MPYAYLGPEGTFTEAALRAIDPGAEALACPTIQAALAAVRAWHGGPCRGADREFGRGHRDRYPGRPG